jgi:hypothetical protein
MGVYSIWGRSLGRKDLNKATMNQKNAVLVIKPDGDADVQEQSSGRPLSVPFDARDEACLAARTKLSRRRAQGDRFHGKGPSSIGSHQGVNCMTLSECSLVTIPEFEVDRTPRRVGMLTEAEHFGRLK